METQTSERPAYLLPASILIAGVMVSGSLIYLVESNRSGAPSAGNVAAEKGTANISDAVGDITARDVILGDPNAPVTVIEYGDYQCPFCARFFSEVEEPLRENYIKSGKVKMVFRNFQFLGPESVAAAEAAECAKDQKQFWGYHDALYREELADGKEHNGNLNKDLFLKIAGDLKLDLAAFTGCIDSKKYNTQVTQETQGAQAFGVNATPTSFVNGEKVQGAQPYAQFAAAIDRILASQ